MRCSLPIRRFAYVASGKPNNVLAIRREDASVYERRAALAPQHVRKLIDKGYEVLVQPSNKRIYNNYAYAESGAIVQEDINKASVIMGVKEVCVDNLLPDKTYCFFSHVIKAFPPNMKMLDCILKRNIRLIDYETLVNSEGKRVVAFGKYAGMAGAINLLHGLGLRLWSLGHNNPFLHIGLAHTYRDTDECFRAVQEVGFEICLGLMPCHIGPLTFVITGRGSVAQGVQTVFEHLPFKYVEVKDLPKVVKEGSSNIIYGVKVPPDVYLKRNEDGGYDRQEYRSNPEKYHSIFADEIAPYASVIINGLYWESGYPRLLTIADTKNLFSSRPSVSPVDDGCPTLPHHLLAVCDIGADPKGPIELVTKNTSIDMPFFLYDYENQKTCAGPFKGPGVLVCSMDNMPSQLALEATDHFGALLLPYMEEIMSSDATKPLEDQTFGDTVRGGVIASNGKLTDKYKYIDDLRKITK